MMSGRGRQEALALVAGQVFSLAVRCEQFIRHLFTIAEREGFIKWLILAGSGVGQGKGEHFISKVFTIWKLTYDGTLNRQSLGDIQRTSQNFALEMTLVLYVGRMPRGI